MKNNSGLVGRLINSNNWDPDINVVEQLNEFIDVKIKELEPKRIDTYNLNNESKKIIGIKNLLYVLYN
jgi:hypothetical protein